METQKTMESKYDMGYPNMPKKQKTRNSLHWLKRLVRPLFGAAATLLIMAHVLIVMSAIQEMGLGRFETVVLSIVSLTWITMAQVGMLMKIEDTLFKA